MRYTAILEAQPEGCYHAFCPTLTGCHSEGDTLDEAITNIREAIALYIQSLTAHGEPLPIEDILFKLSRHCRPSLTMPKPPSILAKHFNQQASFGTLSSSARLNQHAQARINTSHASITSRHD